ncbi:hypothetical protein PR202_ga15975 [Eleusine coracana subsp. coracana]|uniref:RING-type E3 ubiquitin transferase n=1 Tax=Eleusine coracana subsp. coracana TaxID=191504 RepID=A0AAV5CLM6_ELECO|nr:hypothetical protein QOZ80_6BG0487000 [Eleusine coracana subsp. coracana]GJM98923.1 hypothetical protein PR202_ga15975 [Eleusine coracana subsp. coracana]
MAAVRRAGGRFLVPEIDAHGHGFLFVGGASGVARLLAEAPTGRDPSPPPSAASATAARITPAVLFVTVVLAVVLLVSGLLHVLRRLFIKSNSAGAGGAERQLQQLFFPPHEDGGGLDQAAIDALPEFAYGELAAAGKAKAKADRPFDCAVCLTEFADADRLRLLPVCGHAFHVACIDVWLRSSATCPLCRAALRGFAAAAVAAAAAAAADAGVDDVEEQKQQGKEEAAAPASDASVGTAAAGSVVLPVRLGRFKNLGADGAEASTSVSPRLDGRRCFSMGSYQYVLSDEQLLVSVHVKNGAAAAMCTRASSCGAEAAGGGDDQQQGKKVYARGDSFSVSKIWQWRGSQRRLPAGLCADDSLPWAPTGTRRESDTAT